MNHFSTAIIFLLVANNVSAQSNYTAANFAVSGDTFYLTKAPAASVDFDITGSNTTWDYSTLSGVSQRRLIFRLPTQTGFSFLQWPYIYNSANVNLSSTDEQTVAVLGLQQTNPNDYYLKNANYLQQKAGSYTVSLNSNSFNEKYTYTNPDTLYKFPFTYNSINSSHAAYSFVLPQDIYYRNVQLNRKDTVNGWGTLITPYGNFTNCIKYVSTLTEVDSISINGTPVITNDTIIYREYKWFDPAKKFPVLVVKQTKTGNHFITQSVEYFDDRQYYQPNALFTYIPLTPNMGDTVSFQNLSTNGYAYKWYFNDPSSGINDSATAINPQHIFVNPGTYMVQLIAYNGNLTDTFSLAIQVNPVNITYTFTGNGNWSDAANWSNHAVPPANLPATNSIIIDPVAGGECLLDTTQHIAAGAAITINSGKKFIVPGLLKIQ